MAEKIAVDLLINATESARTVKELKQNLKDLKNAALEVGEGSKEFAKITAAASQAKDRLDDLNEGINRINPENLGASFARLGTGIASGFQAATGAAALFGAESKDLEKQLLKVQAATAFAQGIQGVQDLGKAFKAFFMVLRTNPLGLVLTGLTALTAGYIALAKHVDNANSQVDEMTASLEQQKIASGLSVASIDLEIIALGGLAKNEEKIIELRRQKFKEQIKIAEAEAEIARQTLTEAATTQSFLEKTLSFFGQSQLAFAVNLDKIDKAGEKSKEAIANQKKLLAEFIAFENEQEQKNLNNTASNNAAALAEAQKKRDADSAARMVEFNLDQENAALQAKIIADRNQEVKDHEQFERENKLLAIEENAAAQTAIYKKQYDDEIAFAANKAAAIQSIEQGSFQILSNLGNLFIKDSQKLQKFQKTLAIAQIAADTAKALMGALSNANAPTADNIATGGLAGIAKYIGLAAQITSAAAKAKSILNSGGSSGSLNVGSVGGGVGGGVTGSAGVQLNQVASANTQLNPTEIDNGNGSFKVFVTETDITKAQKNISLINNKALVE